MKLLYLLLLSFSSVQLLGQGVFVDALQRQKEVLHELHQEEFGSIRNLISGRQHIALYHFTIGHPFFQKKGWFAGSLETRLQSFPKLTLRYDVYRDALVYLPDSLVQETLWINKDQVLGFSLGPHQFIHLGLGEELRAMEAQGMKPGYYEAVFRSRISLFRKHRKELKGKSGDPKAHSEFYDKKALYLFNKDRFYRIKKKKHLLEALAPHRNAIKSYMRKNAFLVKKMSDAQFVNVLSYYENL